MTENPELYAARRKEILAAALKCFGEQGFRATTMAMIARRIGMSVGNLYNYFRGKSDILEELINREVALMSAQAERIRQQGFQDKSLPSRALHDLAISRLNPISARIAVEILAESTRNRRIGDMLARFEQRWQEVLLPFYEDLLGDREKARTAYEVDFALIHGLSLRVLQNPGLDAGAVADEVVRRLIR